MALLSLCVAASLLAPGAARAGERGLSLAEAIALSLDHPAVLAARESLAQARADVRSASLLPNPTLTGEAALLALGKRYTPEEPGGPPEVSGTLSYPIDWLLFGKRSAAIGSASAGVQIAEAEYEDLVRQRVGETTAAFVGVLEAEALRVAAAEAVEDLERTEAAIRRAVASGGRPQVELNRVRLELQAASRSDRSVRAALVAARARLWALIGREGPIDRLDLSGTLDAPLTVRPMPASEAFAVASENRPDLRALRGRAARARKDEVVEARNARPETSLGFGVARQFQESIGAPNVTAWGVSVDIALPLFNRNQGNRARAASAVVQADREIAAALGGLRADVEQAVQDLQATFENATDLGRTSLDLAAQVRDSIRKAYEAGGRPLVELLDAQRSYRETYQAYVTSRADYWRALSQYEAVLGKRMMP